MFEIYGISFLNYIHLKAPRFLRTVWTNGLIYHVCVCSVECICKMKPLCPFQFCVAIFYCTVRLSRGDHSHGVVQIMEEAWAVLCGEGFTDKEARVVCGQLGFQEGMALSLGSFGTFYGRYVRPNITCNGTEDSILDCAYDEFRGCQKDSFLGYAVVSCFNGVLDKSRKQ